MVLDYEWNGILNRKDDVQQSLKEYGFAIRFKYKEDDESFYDCLIPDEGEDYYLCTLSAEEIRDIVDEHPEIPINEKDVDKTDIGDLLYMLDLYCDIYELLDLENAEKVEYFEIVFDTQMPKDSIFNEESPKRQLSMTRAKAKMALKTINKYNLNVYSSNFKNSRKDTFSKIEISQINYCKRILRLCGETVNSFMRKIKRESGKLYWLKDGDYIELK